MLLGILENIFTFAGTAGHEIVFVYEAELVDRSFHKQDAFTAHEDSGAEFTAMWKPLASFDATSPLYPGGLLDLLDGR